MCGKEVHFYLTWKRDRSFVRELTFISGYSEQHLATVPDKIYKTEYVIPPPVSEDIIVESYRKRLGTLLDTCLKSIHKIIHCY